MEVGMSLNTLGRFPPLSSSSSNGDSLTRHALFSPTKTRQSQKPSQQHRRLVVDAKGKKGMAARQYQRAPPPPLPKLEDDGNPKFVIFIRMANTVNLDELVSTFKHSVSEGLNFWVVEKVAVFLCHYVANVYLWYPLNIVTGGTTAKIMVAAKDNFLGKYIYKDTLARNLAAVIYNDEKEIQKMAMKQFRVLRSAKDFRYGYKLVENNNLRAALAANDVIELPTQDELKTVLDKVKDFFGDAKESFGKMTFLNSGEVTSEEDTQQDPKEKSPVKS